MSRAVPAPMRPIPPLWREDWRSRSELADGIRTALDALKSIAETA